jgi:hypothetical protein
MVSVDDARLGYFDRLFTTNEESISVELDTLLEECDNPNKLNYFMTIVSWTLNALSDKKISESKEIYKNVERRNVIFRTHSEIKKKILLRIRESMPSRTRNNA